MTTIAWDGVTLAVDSRMMGGDMIRSEDTQKLFRVGDAWVAISGGYEDALAAVDWLRKGSPKEKPELGDSFCMLVAQDGKVRRYEQKLVGFDCIAEWVAAGSGYEVALGAMAAGASAIEAVKIAARFDPSTNDKVQSAVPFRQAALEAV